MKWSLVIFIASLIIGYNLYDDFDPSKLKGKNVVITGASEGIGEHLAYHYARYGARVLITARTESKLKKVVERCKQEGSEDGLYLYHVADMLDTNAGPRLIEVAKEKLGGIDYLVLNHILVKPLNPWLSTSENITLLEDIMKVNFFAYVRTASSAMESLERSHGSLIVMSSFLMRGAPYDGGDAGNVSKYLPDLVSRSGAVILQSLITLSVQAVLNSSAHLRRMPQANLAAYSTSKFALEGFFGALRQELRDRGVDVSITMCYISFTDTTTAVEQLQNYRNGVLIKNVYAASTSDVASRVVRGGALRQRDVFYFYSYARLATLAYNMFPTVLEYFAAAVNQE